MTGDLIEDVTVSSTNQEHGIITSRILPDHACATADAYARYHVADGSDQISSVWERVNGW